MTNVKGFAALIFEMLDALGLIANGQYHYDSFDIMVETQSKVPRHDKIPNNFEVIRRVIKCLFAGHTSH
jgi:hypothetical protein